VELSSAKNIEAKSDENKSNPIHDNTERDCSQDNIERDPMQICHA